MIAILQPIIPHYREAFFKGIQDKFQLNLFCYESINDISAKSFLPAETVYKTLKSIKKAPFLLYNPFIFLDKNTTIIVLMIDVKHLSTWFLLITKIFHKRKIILWGQGISIKHFLDQEQKPFFLTKLFLKLADGVWFYTEKECNIWKKEIPRLNAISLNNTLSDIDEILKISDSIYSEKNELRDKYKIKEPVILIYCARFNQHRRIDLIVNLIENVDSKKIGFIVIGEGEIKPDFGQYQNVYDFGKVYNRELKNDLFKLSDIYFQPAWLGLSVVEAMAYGKPIFSFRRNKDLHQCVEYFYVKNNYNGKIFENSDEIVSYLETIDHEEINRLGQNAKSFVKENLSMKQMVENALSIL